MRHSHSQTLSDAQVARLETRRKTLGLSRAALLKRFEEALQREGCVHTLASARMRLDRVLNPRLRRPVSEATLLALAQALDWSLPDLESALQLTETQDGARALGHTFHGHVLRPRAITAREIAFAVLLLFQLLPRVQAEEISANDLVRTYTAIEETWKRGTNLLGQWPKDLDEKDATMASIHSVLQSMLQDTLQPILARFAKLGAAVSKRSVVSRNGLSAMSRESAFMGEVANATRNLSAGARRLQNLLLDS